MRKKANKLKLLEGNPGKREFKPEIKPKPLTPPCPDWLPEEAKQYWRQLAAKLEPLGLLTEVDGVAFTDLCLCLSRLKIAEQRIDREGLLIPCNNGSIIKNPACQVAREYRSAAYKWAAKFGLNPVDRSSLNVAEPEVDELELLLKGGK